MAAHPIDTEALRRLADEHQPDGHGPGKCGKDDCFTSCAECGEDWPCLMSQILDALTAAEHRATRAEAQSEARRINAEYWKDLARGRWARIKAVQALIDQADRDGDPTLTASRIQWAIDGETV